MYHGLILGTRWSLLLVIVLMTAANTLAWGDEGHSITVRIAANFLTPAARNGVIQLIRTDIENNEFFYKLNCPDVVSQARKTNFTPVDEINLAAEGMACVSSWADPPLKRQRSYTSNWHFVDIPVISATTKSPKGFNYDASRDCQTDPQNGDCAIQALLRLEHILANKKVVKPLSSYTKNDVFDNEYGEELTSRAEALKYFIHIVGDIHQPLHCVTEKKDASAVTDAKDHGDVGGNNKLASWYNDTSTFYGFMNLHSIWDGEFIKRTMATNHWSDADYARQLIKSIPTNKSELLAMSDGDFNTWVSESYKAAVSNGYGTLPQYDTECVMSFTDPKTKKTRTTKGCYRLGDEYYTLNNPIVERQLKYGGVRLARLLDNFLL